MQEKLKGWFSEIEINELITDDIKMCIKNCVSPYKDDIFNAFKGLKPEDVKVLIIGQDPYPEIGRADGLAFSFGNGDKPKDSLGNIFADSSAYSTRQSASASVTFV